MLVSNWFFFFKFLNFNLTLIDTLADREEEPDRPTVPYTTPFVTRMRTAAIHHQQLVKVLFSQRAVIECPMTAVDHLYHSPVVSLSPYPYTTYNSRTGSIHVPGEATATPFDLGAADDDRGRLEALNDVAERLHSALITNAEERREVEFLNQEDLH
jgi:hypothetical protein